MSSEKVDAVVVVVRGVQGALFGRDEPPTKRDPESAGEGDEVIRRNCFTRVLAMDRSMAEKLQNYELGATTSPHKLWPRVCSDDGFDGILCRVRYDPAMLLEAVAIFGEPRESIGRLSSPRIGPISDDMIEDGRDFHIQVLPSAALP